MTENKHILLLVTVSDIGRSSGEGVTALSLARSFCRQDYDVTLLALQSDLGKLPFDPENVRVIATPLANLWGLPANLSTLPQFAIVAWILMTRRPDLVYIRTSTLSPLISVLARFIGKCRVVSEHNGLQAEESEINHRPGFLRAIERASQLADTKVAHRVRVVIPGIAEALVERGAARDKFFVIGNGSNTDLVRPIERAAALRELQLDAKLQYMGFIGNLAPWQGLKTVLRALPLIRARNPKVHLLIAGDGVERNELEIQAHELRLMDHCHFLGEVPYSQISTILGAFDLALLPTEKCVYASIGRSPLKLPDYAAAGKIVLAADIAVVRDLADEGWVHLYPVGDEAELAEQALKILSDNTATRRLSNKARKFAEEHFSWNKIGQQILEKALANS